MNKYFNESNYIMKSKDNVGRNTTYFAFISSRLLWPMAVLVNLISSVGCGFGAFFYFTSHIENLALNIILSALVALISETLSSWFYYQSFSAMFSKKYIIGSVFLVFASMVYFTITYQATTKGLVGISTSVGEIKEQSTYLTYQIEIDSTLNNYNAQLDSLKKQLNVYYVKQDSITKGYGKKYLYSDKQTTNKLISLISSQITNLDAEKLDRLNELKQAKKQAIADNEIEKNINERASFNYAIITLVLVPIMYFLLILMNFLTALDSVNIITKVVSFDKNTQEVAIVEKKK